MAKKQPRIRYSLRLAMLVVGLVAIICGWLHWRSIVQAYNEEATYQTHVRYLGSTDEAAVAFHDEFTGPGYGSLGPPRDSNGWPIDSPTALVRDSELNVLRGERVIVSLLIDARGITNRGLEPIGTMENLRELDLHAPNITMVGMQHIVHLESLQQLTLRQPSLTDEEVNQLRKQMPKCEIVVTQRAW